MTDKVTVTQREKVNGVTETCTARHVETTERIKELTETREIKGEVEEIKNEHTHMELARLNGGELAECVETRCEQRDSLLMERGEGICPLEVVHDQVGPVELRGVEGMSEANGCTRSLGGMEAPEPLVVAQFPSVIVPECVVKSVVKRSVSVMACVSACEGLKHRRVQTGDENGEPNGPLAAILVTAPVSRDVASEACSASAPSCRESGA